MRHVRLEENFLDADRASIVAVQQRRTPLANGRFAPMAGQKKVGREVVLLALVGR
jgi:hypothetical protein